MIDWPISWSLLAALLCVGVMGLAIQRGGTCTVAAVKELVELRSAWRLLALAEASLWVVGGLLVAKRLALLPDLPMGHALTAWTLAGAAILGLVAFVNGACVMGSVARIGSGDWAYLATPLGYYWGCLSVDQLFGLPERSTAVPVSPLQHAPPALLWLFVVFFAWRLLRAAWGTLSRQPRIPGAPLSAWSPHAATAVIGVSFLLSLLLAGSAWTYTDVLAEMARAMGAAVAQMGGRLLLMLALLAGAVFGGWSAGLLQSTPPRIGRVLACLGGGFLMGWGSFLTPGGNDGLILIGMPLIYPYAWAAFVTMVVTILAAMLVKR